ncbi:MAG: TIGR01177 family methyltransferase [Halolamina sp.]
MCRAGGVAGVYWLELAGEDDAFAVREAATVAPGAETVAPGVAVAGSLDERRVPTLAYVHAAGPLVGRSAPTVAEARAVVETATLDREGSVAVRARDVRGLADIDTQAAERALGGALVDRGFAVDLDDPDHVLRALFSEGTCAVGWVGAESDRTFADRTPTDRPFFQPGSMAPMDARALVNVAGAGPDRRLLDPMCGTGGVLVEAGLVGADVVGVDAQAKMVAGTRRNLREYCAGAGDDGDSDGADGAKTDFALARGDATRLPVATDAVDCAVFDAPYGRQSKIAGDDLGALVGGALAETRRTVAADGRAVLVADRSWRSRALDAGWRVETVFERRVHRSLTRFVHVLD